MTIRQRALEQLQTLAHRVNLDQALKRALIGDFK